MALVVALNACVAGENNPQFPQMPSRGYDVIGDVHGCAVELKALLKALGYRRMRGVWRHPQRVAVFVGDLLDRGPEIVEVLETVAAMVETGSATCILGNHERDFIFYNLLQVSSEPIRERTHVRTEQLQATHRQLGSASALQFWLSWCRSLPVFFEAPGLRVVHAAWHEQAAEFWCGRNLADNEICAQLADPKSGASTYLDWLLFGPYLLVEREGKVSGVRVRWYNRPDQLARDSVWHAAFRRRVGLPHRRLTESERSLLHGYTACEPPLITGHQSLPLRAALKPLRANLACVDYSSVYGGRLCAYRWSGELRLLRENFVAVTARTGLGS